jgi:pyrimidine operon attenuation protein/uracil phosphoribosyltransferase
MDVKIKARIMDAKKIKRVFQRITTEIIERNRNLNQLVIVGIRTRGVPIARRIQKLIKNLEEEDVPLGILDATLYRDDFSDLKKQHKIKKTEIGFDISDKDILLAIQADYTGKFLPTSRRENVKVRLKELDDIDEVLITEPIEIQ